MKCEEVQSHFSDYLDETAEGPRAKGIEAHLTGCPICSEEFSDLLQCRKLISSLPMVEPPVGFATRVMANVAEAANHTGFWKRLFIPLKLNIPLQASAVMIVALLSFYVYQKEDRHIPPPAAVSETSPSPAADRARATSRRQDVTARKPAIGKKPSFRQAVNEAKAGKVASSAHGGNAQPSPRPVDHPQSGDAGFRTVFPIPAQGVVAGAGAGGSIGMPRQPTFRLFPTDRELPDLGEPVADYELFVRVTPRRQRDLSAAGNSRLNGGKSENPVSTGVESSRQFNLQPSSVLDVVWYRVPQERYEQFKSDLAAQAKIESEIPIGIKDREWSFRSDGPLFIKVTLLGSTE